MKIAPVPTRTYTRHVRVLVVILGVAFAGCGRIGFGAESSRDGASSEGSPATLDAATCPTCEQGLVARWRLDESSGTVAVDDVGQHDGTLRAAASWQPSAGKFGGAASLANAYITVPLDLPTVLGPTFSVALWVRLAPGQSAFDRYFAQFYFDGANHGALMFDNNNGNGVRCAPNLGATWPFLEIDGIVTSDVWHHLVCLFDGTAVRIYVDGIEVRMFPASGGLTTSSPGLVTAIGTSIIQNGIGTQNSLTGLVDEVRIYDRGITPAEVAALGTP